MKITFEYTETVGTGTRIKVVVLGDDTGSAPVADFRDAAAAQVQPAEYPRATNVKYFHRALVNWELSWNTTRLHTSPEAAYLYRLTHKIEVTKAKGTLKLFLGTRTISGPAIVRSADTANSHGVRTVTQYQVMCDNLA